MSKHLQAIIIGSGVAGLASAVRLAVQGFEVTVYEKNDHAGGKMSALHLKDFQFDTGPSLFVQPQNIEELFQLAGENLSDYLTYTAIPISCKYFYEDGVELTAWADVDNFAHELSAKIGEDPGRVKDYLRQSAKLFNNIGSVFLNHSLQKRSILFKSDIRRAITSVRWKYLFKTMNEINLSSFSSLSAVQLFNRYATYTGSDPFRAPGMLCLLPHAEYSEGTFYPKGGMISIRDALYRLALAKGVIFQFNAPVQRIIYNDGKVKGVVVDHQNVYANVVVSNTDVYTTYQNLLNDKMKGAKILRQERSSSAIVFYWGINGSFPRLDLHNIFFSKNYKAEFDAIFQHKKIYEDPTVYLNITSKYENDKAPAGKENWFIMVNAPSNYGQDWSGLMQQCRSQVVAKLGRMLKTEIEPLIEVEETLDPISIESHSGAFQGAIYGTSSNSRKNAFLRHPNFSRHIQGLYFVGGTVHPGGGIPLCLKSAKIMSEMVAHNLRYFNH